MGRRLRIDPDGGLHHVMNRGVDRTNIFRADGDRRWFVQLLGEAAEAAGVRVVAYCLVGNHFHLLLHCPSGGLSVAMWKLTAEYARSFNQRYDRDGPLFRGRFTSKHVDSEDYLVHLLGYIHRNSLDIGVSPDEWPWSSYPAYLGRVVPPPWLAIDDALQSCGGPAAHRADVERTTRHDERTGALCDPVEVHSSWSATRVSATIERLGELVDRHGPELGDHLRRDVLLVAALARSLRVAELVEPLGAPSTAAVRARAHRARSRLSADPELATIVTRIVEAA